MLAVAASLLGAACGSEQSSGAKQDNSMSGGEGGVSSSGEAGAGADSKTQAGADTGSSGSSGSSSPSFVRQVWPILASECLECHVTPQYGDFRTAESAYATLSDPKRMVGNICSEGDPLLPLLSPGDPEGSGLWRLIAIGYRGCTGIVYGMPKNRPALLRDLNPDAAELIRSWIANGAPAD